MLDKDNIAYAILRVTVAAVNVTVYLCMVCACRHGFVKSKTEFLEKTKYRRYQLLIHSGQQEMFAND